MINFLMSRGLEVFQMEKSSTVKLMWQVSATTQLKWVYVYALIFVYDFILYIGHCLHHFQPYSSTPIAACSVLYISSEFDPFLYSSLLLLLLLLFYLFFH